MYQEIVTSELRGAYRVIFPLLWVCFFATQEGKWSQPPSHHKGTSYGEK